MGVDIAPRRPGEARDRQRRGAALRANRVSRATGRCAAVLLVLVGCPSDTDTRTPTGPLAETREVTPAGAPAVRSSHLRHRAATQAARAWLDALELDPVTLIAHGVKGKKKLAELLSAYLYLLRYSSDPSERPVILGRVRELAEQAARPEYHNMLRCDVREFNENKMSYLRVAYLLEQFGEDTRLYRAHLDEALPRLDLALASRPPGQRAPFARYYDYFGWTQPAVLQQSALRLGVVAERLPFARYRRGSSYSLAHEVSDAFRNGLRLTQDVFDRDDRSYLAVLLPALTIRFIGANNLDLVAELVSSMTYLGLHTLPAHRQGIEFLLASQNDDGSWGDYGSYRTTLGDYVDQKFYLHTTMVALRALLEANDGAWLRSGSARRP